jgi:hypothetical protein
VSALAEAAGAALRRSASTESNQEMVNMTASWKIASMLALPLSLALVGTGCMAQNDEEPADAETAGAEQAQPVAETAQEETTGEAKEACGGFGGYGFGGYGGFGCGVPFGGFGCGVPFGGFGCGYGFPGYGFGRRFWGGCGGCGGCF